MQLFEQKQGFRSRNKGTSLSPKARQMPSRFVAVYKPFSFPPPCCARAHNATCMPEETSLQEARHQRSRDNKLGFLLRDHPIFGTILGSLKGRLLTGASVIWSCDPARAFHPFQTDFQLCLRCQKRLTFPPKVLSPSCGRTQRKSVFGLATT